MEKTAWPGWAIGLGRGAPICHIFDRGVEPPEVSRSRREVIVGGGLTAAQLALSRAQPGRRVTVLSRHPIRVHDFDVDPGWLGPRFANDFARERDIANRRAAITQARFRGSMTKQVAKAIRQADPSILDYRQSVEVVVAAASPDGIRLELNDATAIVADNILLATGFYTGRPGGVLVDDLVGQVGLPVAPCGSPILDDCLRWHPRLFLMGALAELTVGPPAKNISGARFAATRILDSVR
jgi:glycine/D-amino acid oxidase-like deaminating enzyme